MGTYCMGAQLKWPELPNPLSNIYSNSREQKCSKVEIKRFIYCESWRRFPPSETSKKFTVLIINWHARVSVSSFCVVIYYGRKIVNSVVLQSNRVCAWRADVVSCRADPLVSSKKDTYMWGATAIEKPTVEKFQFRCRSYFLHIFRYSQTHCYFLMAKKVFLRKCRVFWWKTLLFLNECPFSDAKQTNSLFWIFFKKLGKKLALNFLDVAAHFCSKNKV